MLLSEHLFRRRHKKGPKTMTKGKKGYVCRLSASTHWSFGLPSSNIESSIINMTTYAPDDQRYISADGVRGVRRRRRKRRGRRKRRMRRRWWGRRRRRRTYGNSIYNNSLFLDQIINILKNEC